MKRPLRISASVLASDFSRLGEEARTRGVIAFSSGNHAQAMALSGQLLGVPVTIVMPAASRNMAMGV